VKKTLLIFFLLVPYYLSASELELEIEKKASELSGCNKNTPCEVMIERNDRGYIVKVKRSVLITEFGVLKYTTGSIHYHIFDEKGTYVESRSTT